jgi:hypothetical protein
MTSSIIEFLRVVRFAIHNWQRTLCLATLLTLIAGPALVYVAMRDRAASKPACVVQAVTPRLRG